jgi:Fe-S cluster assembly ATP-binding protein
MLKISDIHINLSENKKEIVKGVSLTVNPGEVHLLNGKNGSGKSTLVNAIMGNPAFEISNGKIEIANENYSDFTIKKLDPELVNIEDRKIDLTQMEPNERSLAGVFLANQYPVEIPGVSLSSYLRLIYNSRRSKDQQLSVFKFKNFLTERAEVIKYPDHLLKRNLNEGFSGGEKKKTEILQMLILEPRYVMLDEIDSGLDKHSVKEVFQGLVDFKQLLPTTSFIIITHYDRVQEYLKPDFIHEMADGKLID